MIAVVSLVFRTSCILGMNKNTKNSETSEGSLRAPAASSLEPGFLFLSSAVTENNPTSCKCRRSAAEHFRSLTGSSVVAVRFTAVMFTAERFDSLMV